MFKLANHICFLEQKMKSLTHLPTIFEYYSALHLSRVYQSRFYVYPDIRPAHKMQHRFPIQDKGVDIIDEHFQHIAQVKYYSPKSIICYGRLSTFLATPILVSRTNLQMSLIRTSHCSLHSEIQSIISNGDMMDITLCDKEFLHYIKSIKL